MLPLTEFAKFESAKSAVQIVKPWWNLITDYLLKFLLIISLLVGGMELTSGSFDCLPTVDCSLRNSRTLFSKANYHNACTVFFTSRKAMDCKGTTVAVELTKYPAHYAKYVNSECRKTAAHWFASYFSFILFGQALFLFVLDNFLVKFPPTASVIETFSILVIECYESPETSFCLPHELFNQPDRNERSVVDRKPDKQRSGENEQLLSNKQQDNESFPSSSKALSSESKISVDIATAVQVMALYEKVKRFMERIKSSQKIWIVYLIQTSIQICLTVVFVFFNAFHVTSLKGSVKCSVDSVCIPVVHGHFTCTHNLQPMFERALIAFIVVLSLYLLSPIGVVIRTISKNKSDSDHNIANFPKLEKDARFLLQLLEAYDKSYAQQFRKYMSEDSEKDLKAKILKMHWPLSKLEDHCSINETEGMTLSLTGLSGIPETLFDLTSLNKLELKRCELQHDEFHQIEKLRNLEDLALVECKLNKIPEKILCITWLKVLTLKYNSINTIGSDIGKLKELTTLDLTGNELVSIDESLKNLGNLHTLYLFKNPELGIAAIKTALECRMLKNFKLSDSKIQELNGDVLRKYKKLNGKLTL